MLKLKKIMSGTFVLFMTVMPFISRGQTEKKERKHEFYFSWGYNKEWYTHSNLKVNQPSLGNDYALQHVSAHDHPGWDEGLFSKALSIPQYNYRLGYIIDRKKGWGVEINFDHTKYIIGDQQASIKGTLNHKAVDSSVAFNQANGFSYFLNNGANFLLFNVTKRWHLAADRKQNVQLDVFAKAGVGPVIPHVENTLFGKSNDPHFQLGGWNVGLEGALRATFFKYVYLEYANKLDYARYSGLKVYEGKAKQGFGTYEMILSLGVTFPMGRREE
jgi:hypothetical protein